MLLNLPSRCCVNVTWAAAGLANSLSTDLHVPLLGNGGARWGICADCSKAQACTGPAKNQLDLQSLRSDWANEEIKVLGANVRIRSTKNMKQEDARLRKAMARAALIRCLPAPHRKFCFPAFSSAVCTTWVDLPISYHFKHSFCPFDSSFEPCIEAMPIFNQC